MKRIICAAACGLSLFIASCASSPSPDKSASQTGSNEQAAQPAVPADVTADAPAAVPEAELPVETKKDDGSLSEPLPRSDALLADDAPLQAKEERTPAPVQTDDFTEPLVRDEPYTEHESQAPAAAQKPQDIKPSAAQETHDAAKDAAVQTAAVPSAASPAATSAEAKPAAAQKAAPAQKPAATTQKPAATTQKPAATTQKPAATTQKPAAKPSVKKTAPVQAAKAEETASSETGTEQTDEKKQDDTPSPSRSVTVRKNQYLDVAYPGTGWIYLGETNGTKNMTFFGRKLGETDTTFTLRARTAGTSVLHFYKNDILSGKYIDDYLTVTIEDAESETQEHAVAPSYAEAVPPRPAASEQDGTYSSQEQSSSQSLSQSLSQLSPSMQQYPVQQTESSSATPASSAATGTAQQSQDEQPVRTVVQTAESSPASQSSGGASSSAAVQTQRQGAGQSFTLGADAQNESADDLLKNAETAYTSKEYQKSLAYLDLFFQKAVSRIDEGLYLQGQVLEAKSPVQNIKSAIDSYDILQRNWPESQLWKQAQQRSIYLKRMYIDIR